MAATEPRRRIGIDPSLLAAFHGGPLDGMRTADFPPHLAGRSLTGCEVQWPLGEPAHYSLYAVYRCTSAQRVDRAWRFDFVRLQGPDEERLIATRSTPVLDRTVDSDLDERDVRGLFTSVAEGAPLTPAKLMPTRARFAVPGESR